MRTTIQTIPSETVLALLARWQVMAKECRTQAGTLRGQKGASFLTIACHEARADAYERLIAELTVAGYGAAVPGANEPFIEAEQEQRGG